MAYTSKVKVTTARFFNVAFSNGSLPDGWIHRVMHKQSLVAPNNCFTSFGATRGKWTDLYVSLYFG